jgi:hypothetical protein
VAFNVEVNSIRLADAMERIKTAGDGRVIDTEEFLATFYEEMGGPREVARRMAALARDDKTSRDTQRRIYEFVLQMHKYLEAQRGPPVDFSTMDERELQAVLRESLDGVGQSEAEQETPPTHTP